MGEQPVQILLAEDDVSLGRALKRALEEAGHDVTITSDGLATLELALAGRLDVILLDIGLPVLDGLDVCRRLREGGVESSVIVITGRGDLEMRVAALDAGADDCLVKPFAVEELLARIRAATRRSLRAANARDQLTAGDLTLDVARHSALRGEREIELTVKEFQLLELLLRNSGKVLSRAEILDNVWQYDRRFASNVVDIYIHYLRNKIDRGFGRPLIHTIRGVGYTLRAS